MDCKLLWNWAVEVEGDGWEDWCDEMDLKVVTLERIH